MYEAQFSLVICGSNEERWTAYAFDDTEFDGEELYDKIFPCEGVHADPVALDDDIDAERPIWNPREYFLKVVEARMAQATVEWEVLVRSVERSIREYVRYPAIAFLDYFLLLAANSSFRERGILQLYRTKPQHTVEKE
jgi:hypothetical protein